MCGIKGKTKVVREAIAGQVVSFDGIGQALSKAGTLTNSPSACSIRHMEMAVTPIMQHSIKPKNKMDLMKMVAELQRIVNADSTAVLYKDTETDVLVGRPCGLCLLLSLLLPLFACFWWFRRPSG